MSRSLAMVLGLLACGCKDKRECKDRDGDECQWAELDTCECDECGTTWCCGWYSKYNRDAWHESAVDCDCLDEHGGIRYDDTAFPDCIIEY